jgi:hypothetical protein
MQIFRSKRRGVKLRFTAVLLAVLYGCTCSAGQKLTSGTIVSMQSVECGSKKEGKNKSMHLVCQQYIVHTSTTEYQIRQPKPSEQEIFPANTMIQFVLDKNKMKFKLNGKKYEFLVVGTSAVAARRAAFDGPS